jgi:hypothetical protein
VRLRSIGFVAILATVFLGIPVSLRAETRYTEKQIEQFSSYLGKTYWITADKSLQPTFFSAPSADAQTFQPTLKEGFELKEIVEKHTEKPYYRAAFESGKEGFIPVTSFLQQLNGALLSIDPDRNAKAKTAKETEQEEKRRDWIRQQKWPQHVKDAALKKQPTLGMNKKEVSAVMGKPKSVVRLRSGNQLVGKQEQWIYENGPVLTFSEGIIVRIQ